MDILSERINSYLHLYLSFCHPVGWKSTLKVEWTFKSGLEDISLISCYIRHSIELQKKDVTLLTVLHVPCKMCSIIINLQYTRWSTTIVSSKQRFTCMKHYIILAFYISRRKKMIYHVDGWNLFAKVNQKLRATWSEINMEKAKSSQTAVRELDMREDEAWFVSLFCEDGGLGSINKLFAKRVCSSNWILAS